MKYSGILLTLAMALVASAQDPTSPESIFVREPEPEALADFDALAELYDVTARDIELESRGTEIFARAKCTKQGKAVPKCSIGCLQKAGKAAGCPNKLDFKCRCNKSKKISKLATKCVVSKCGRRKAQKTAQTSKAFCKCIG